MEQAPAFGAAAWAEGGADPQHGGKINSNKFK